MQNTGSKGGGGGMDGKRECDQTIEINSHIDTISAISKRSQ